MCATSYYFEEMTLTYLVKSVDIFPIGCEIHETCCQVNQATNHQILLAELLLGAAAKLSAPHHIAVTPLHTDKQTEYCKCSLVMNTFNSFFVMSHFI